MSRTVSLRLGSWPERWPRCSPWQRSPLSAVPLAACPQRDAPFGHRPSRQSTTRTARHREDQIRGTNDKAQNKAEELKGQGKEALGGATGDEELEAEGRTDQAKSDLKQAGEKVKDAFTR